MLGAIFRWVTGRRAGDIEREERLATRLAAELAASEQDNKVAASGANLDAATQPQRKANLHRQPRD
jgi:hypothetical protein